MQVLELGMWPLCLLLLRDTASGNEAPQLDVDPVVVLHLLPSLPLMVRDGEMVILPDTMSSTLIDLNFAQFSPTLDHSLLNMHTWHFVSAHSTGCLKA